MGSANGNVYSINEGANALPSVEIKRAMPPIAFKEGSSNRKCQRKFSGEFSYAEIIEKAIGSSPTKQMTFRQICEWLIQNVDVIRESKKDWENSVRYNLSLHSRFIRVSKVKEMKGAYWAVNPKGTTKAKKRAKKLAVASSSIERSDVHDQLHQIPLHHGDKSIEFPSFSKPTEQTQQFLHASANNPFPTSDSRVYPLESLSPEIAGTFNNYSMQPQTHLPEGPARFSASLPYYAFGAGKCSVESLSPELACSSDGYLGTQPHLPEESARFSTYIPNPASGAVESLSPELADSSYVYLGAQTRLHPPEESARFSTYISDPAFGADECSVNSLFPELAYLSYEYLDKQTLPHPPYSPFPSFVPSPALGSGRNAVESEISGGYFEQVQHNTSATPFFAYDPNPGFGSGQTLCSVKNGACDGFFSNIYPSWVGDRDQNAGYGSSYMTQRTDNGCQQVVTPSQEFGEFPVPALPEYPTRLDEILHDLGISGEM